MEITYRQEDAEEGSSDHGGSASLFLFAAASDPKLKQFTTIITVRIKHRIFHNKTIFFLSHQGTHNPKFTKIT